MLPLQRCRDLLGAAGAGLSDDQVLKVRDELTAMARVALAAQRSAESQTGREESVLNAIDTSDHDAVEERAAIIEFDAGYTRVSAVALAAQCARRRRQP